MSGECLLVSVGGSVDPVVHVLREVAPARVVFAVSRESEAVLPEIKRRTSEIGYLEETVVLPDPEDLVGCLAELDAGLRRVARRWPEVATGDLVVDFTGGTKVMSVALALAVIDRPGRFSYVGGGRRAGGGLGTVEPGSERRLERPNPWDVLALQLRPRIAEAFARGQFGEARALAERAAARVSAGRRRLYEVLARLCGAYSDWSAFEFRKALQGLRRVCSDLGLVASAAEDAGFEALAARLEEERGRLERIERAHARLAAGGEAPDPEDARVLLVDLVAAGERLASLSGRHDQAVAVLYSALEKAAKLALRIGHGIETSRAAPGQVPDPLRGEFVARYAVPDRGELRIPLFAGFRLLEALGDPLGRRFAERRDELRSLLDVRNEAFIAHGWKPVRPETFEKLLELALAFLELDRSDLPGLPELPA